VTHLRLALSILLVAILAGCAFGYQARGTLDGVAGELRGKGYPRSAHPGGSFALGDREGRLVCAGETDPAIRGGDPGSCAGERGTGMVRCTDGREIPVTWEAITCRSWRGSGVDAQGKRLEFRVERLSR
jgi:hypothetical protein